MTNYKKHLLFVLVMQVNLLAFAQNNAPKSATALQVPTEGILFVGNSYTYFWNLPQSLAAMAGSRGLDFHTQQSTAGGVNLGQHWRGEKGLKSLDLIKEGSFDIVVLQDHSRRAIDHPDSLLYFGQLLNKKIKRSGAKTYLYMTWAREWDPYMQAPITEKYTELAKKMDATLVPVGLAWQKCRQLRPELNLYDEDGSHPSTLGTYLTACVFFGVITGDSPVGLPKRLVSTDRYGEKLYLNIQSAETALFCQKVAADILKLVER